jgi:hypothetical protein
MNDLPNDCLQYILQYVTIAKYDEADSQLGYLTQCRMCWESKKNCKHLGISEVCGIKFLKLVCKKWWKCISKYFVFQSGPYCNENRIVSKDVFNLYMHTHLEI